MGPKNNMKETNKFKKYNINKEFFLVGRYGGYDSFDVPFVKEAIKEILSNDKNIFFIFCNTEPFIIDQRVRFIDKLILDKDKSLFLDSIDLFIHARRRGETFGLSIYEALNRGIPVISHSKSKERNHIFDIKSIDCLYSNKFQLIQLLKNKKFLDLKNSNLWSNKFKKMIFHKV